MFLFKKVPSISLEDLSKPEHAKVELIDVRSEAEFASGHIARAKNVPLDKLGSYKPKGKKVYVICQAGPRSKRGTQELIAKGIDAYTVDGGMARWSGPTKVGK